MATTRENTHAQASRLTVDSAGGATVTAIAELPNRSHEKAQEGQCNAHSAQNPCAARGVRPVSHSLPLPSAHSAASAVEVEVEVEVEVRDHDASVGGVGSGLESQGADLNDADQAKCMPCTVM
jgi:hypothetical protein